VADHERLRKAAVQAAYQDAFARLALIVTHNSRVAVAIDSALRL
jgi:hypothetical protein